MIRLTDLFARSELHRDGVFTTQGPPAKSGRVNCPSSMGSYWTLSRRDHPAGLRELLRRGRICAMFAGQRPSCELISGRIVRDPKIGHTDHRDHRRRADQRPDPEPDIVKRTIRGGLPRTVAIMVTAAGLENMHLSRRWARCVCRHPTTAFHTGRAHRGYPAPDHWTPHWRLQP